MSLLYKFWLLHEESPPQVPKPEAGEQEIGPPWLLMEDEETGARRKSGMRRAASKKVPSLRQFGGKQRVALI